MDVVFVKRAGVDSKVAVDKAEYDANPDAFELWTDEDEPAPVKASKPVTSAPTQQLLVSKVGKAFVVVDMTGVAFVHDAIEAAGYPSEKAAWKAIADLSKVE